MRYAVLGSLVLLLSAAPAPTIDTLVAKHIDALGGQPALQALHAYVKHGTYRERDLFLPRTIVTQMRPFYRVIGERNEPLTSIHEGYDGSAWEYYPDPGIVVRTGKDAARASRHAALNFVDRLTDYRTQGTVLRLDGERNFFGNHVYVIHVTLADGYEEELFLDQKTYMLDGRSEVVPMHAYGQRYRMYDVYSDYRPEGGVMMAHKDAEIDSATGKVMDEGTLTSVEINPALTAAAFEPPAWHRTPLQTMIDRIYQERDDAAAVMQTYRDFAPVVGITASATGDAVDFTGYQCLKMGQVHTAVTLLTQNVKDHEMSARAHYGLGRALQADGQSVAARAEYARTLALDPNFTRARTALDALK